MRKHPTKSRRVLGSNPIWGTDFSEFPMASTHISFHVYMSGKICFSKSNKRRYMLQIIFLTVSTVGYPVF